MKASVMGRMSRPLRVLAVAELGGNWGHVLRLLPVLIALRDKGHHVRFAVSDEVKTRQVLGDEEIEVVRCAHAMVGVRDGTRTDFDHYAQVLDRCAFGTDDALAKTVWQWADQLAAWQPDVLVTDFAPGALLAAHLHRLPLVQVAIGWEAPPAGPLLPTIRPWKQVRLAEMQALEARMVGRLNRWFDRYGVRPLRLLSDLYGVGTQLLATLPETDHFAPRTRGRYVGPIFSAEHGREVAWRTRRVGASGKRILAYLLPHRRNPAIFEALRGSGAEVIAVLPWLAEEDVKGLETSTFRVWREPVRLAPLLAGADLVVNNAGHGLSCASVLAGVPMLVMPSTVENALFAKRLSATGAARSMFEEGGRRSAGDFIAAMLHDERPRRAAEAIARKYSNRSQAQTVHAVVDGVERAGA